MQTIISEIFSITDSIARLFGLLEIFGAKKTFTLPSKLKVTRHDFTSSMCDNMCIKFHFFVNKVFFRNWSKCDKNCFHASVTLFQRPRSLNKTSSQKRHQFFQLVLPVNCKLQILNTFNFLKFEVIAKISVILPVTLTWNDTYCKVWSQC